MSQKEKNSERKYLFQYVITLVVTLACLISATLYTFFSFSDLAKKDAVRFGESAVQKDAKSLNNFLLKNKNLLEFSSYVVEEALKQDASNADVRERLIWSSQSFSRLVEDSSYSGVYGYIRDEYMDGDGWVPPENFSPLKRPWYQTAFKAHGEIALTAPYVDVRTQKRAISIARRLYDKQSVVATDVELGRILDRAKLDQNNEDGFWLIIDKDGQIIDHSDSTQRNVNYLDSAYLDTELENLGRQIILSKGEKFEIALSGKKYMAFPEIVMDDWFVVKFSDESVLFERVHWILVRSIMLSLLVFLLMVFFCTMSFRNRVKALRASKAKSVFLANMGHEIRTPINGILGMNSIILKEVRDPTLKNYASNVQSAGQSLLAFVNDILDMSKIESGKMVIKPAEYNLFNVLSDCFNIISPRATAKNLRFSIDCDPDIPSGLWGDEIRIRQIIGNLLANAVKYTEYGEVSLSVNYSILPSRDSLKVDNSILLKIVVRDTGIGIRPEEIDRIFGTFQRADEKYNRNSESSGFGLSLTRQLVKMCGGDITVRSRYEEGSTFMVTIPQVVLNVEPMGDFSSKFRLLNTQKVDSEESLLAPNARILVVDDVSLNLKVFRGLLKDTRAKVETAINGSQCLDLVKTKRYDLIFLDHMMPVMDGLETFERMREFGDDFPNKNTPVIMLTADAVMGARESYMGVGFTDYLSKPVKENDLIRVMKRYLPESLLLTTEDLKSFTGESPREEMVNKKGLHAQKMAAKVEPKDEPVIVKIKEESAAPKSRMELLKSVLDVDLGMSYCANDEEFYIEMLNEYIDGNKEESIGADFEKQDWKNYQIQVHALKSTSLTIGAKELSENAKSLEFACKEGDLEFIKKNHHRVMNMYLNVLTGIKRALEKK